jgi:hypothetical protein
MKIILIALFLILSNSWAQLSYRGDLSMGGTTTHTQIEVDLPNGQTIQVSNAGFQVVLKGHLEADLNFDDFGIYLVLDPNITLNDESEIDVVLGLTEAYAKYQLGEFDISSGFERLPLETARLSIPFALSEVSGNASAASPKGLMEGIWSARVLWYPGEYRFRLVGFYQDEEEQFGVTLSAKRFFGDFELEATAIYDNHFTLGINGSGLLGEVVVFGETWLLLNTPIPEGTKTTLRGLLGATGYLGDSLWTLEAGYFPNLGSVDSFPQLLAQWQLPQENTTWSLGGGLGLREDQLAALLAANISVIDGVVSTSFNFNTQLSAEFIVVSTGFEVKGTF